MSIDTKQTSGLALEEIDILFGKDVVATAAEEPEKGVAVEQEIKV